MWMSLDCRSHLLRSVSDLVRCCKGVFLTQRKNPVITHFSCLMWSSRLFELVELATGFLLYKNVETLAVSLIGLFISVGWRLPPFTSPSLWTSSSKLQWTATKLKFNTWNQLQISSLFNSVQNNKGTGLVWIWNWLWHNCPITFETLKTWLYEKTDCNSLTITITLL